MESVTRCKWCHHWAQHYVLEPTDRTFDPEHPYDSYECASCDGHRCRNPGRLPMDSALKKPRSLPVAVPSRDAAQQAYHPDDRERDVERLQAACRPLQEGYRRRPQGRRWCPVQVARKSPVGHAQDHCQGDPHPGPHPGSSPRERRPGIMPGLLLFSYPPEDGVRSSSSGDLLILALSLPGEDQMLQSSPDGAGIAYRPVRIGCVERSHYIQG